MPTHSATFTTSHYPGSGIAHTISWACSCGKSGKITDGQLGATLKRARQAHARHVAAATTR